jgi:hypothetical protein
VKWDGVCKTNLAMVTIPTMYTDNNENKTILAPTENIEVMYKIQQKKCVYIYNGNNV